MTKEVQINKYKDSCDEATGKKTWNKTYQFEDESTEAYIRHHLLHKSARKLLEMSEINGLSEIILRLLEKKLRYDSNFYFFCQ